MTRYFSDFKEIETGCDSPKRPTFGLRARLYEQGLTDKQITDVTKTARLALKL